jgi:hypothetical protein
MTNWSFIGILIDPLSGQSYNLAAVENSAFTEKIRGAADGIAALCFMSLGQDVRLVRLGGQE